jgi:hypothetical protein
MAIEYIPTLKNWIVWAIWQVLATAGHLHGLCMDAENCRKIEKFRVLHTFQLYEYVFLPFGGSSPFKACPKATYIFKQQ